MRDTIITFIQSWIFLIFSTRDLFRWPIKEINTKIRISVQRLVPGDFHRFHDGNNKLFSGNKLSHFSRTFRNIRIGNHLTLGSKLLPTAVRNNSCNKGVTVRRNRLHIQWSLKRECQTLLVQVIKLGAYRQWNFYFPFVALCFACISTNPYSGNWFRNNCSLPKS